MWNSWFRYLLRFWEPTEDAVPEAWPSERLTIQCPGPGHTTAYVGGCGRWVRGLCLAELNTLLHPQDLAPSSSSTTVTSYHSFTRASKATVYYAYLATLGLDAMVAGLPDDSLMLAPPPGAPLHASLLCYLLDCVCRYLHDARVARYALAVPDLLRPWQQHWGFDARSLQVLEVQVFHRAQLEPAVTLYIPCA